MTKEYKYAVSGIWELRETRGGNILPASFSSGKGNLLQLTDSFYTFYEEGNILLQGRYKIQTDTQGQATIEYDDGGVPTDELTVKKDTLTLKPTHPDFATRIYVKID